MPGVPDSPNNRFALGLVATMEESNPWLAGHSLVVADLSARIASELGMSAEEQDLVFTAGLLHDVGKHRLPKSIIEKGGPLTEDERRLVEKHPEWGEALWRRVGRDLIDSGQHFEKDPEWAEARRRKVEAGDDGRIGAIVRHHHERWDGGGYPDGLAGDEIPFGARVIAVADLYMNLTDPDIRTSPPPSSHPVDQLRDGAGSAFDPQIVAAFARALASASEDPENALRPGYAWFGPCSPLARPRT